MIKLATSNGERVGRDASPKASQEISAAKLSKEAAGVKSPPMKALAQEVFLSFEEELNHEQATLTFSEATRGVLVLGAVGSGKTSAVCLPALARAMQKGCAGLALDAKGEFCAWARSEDVPNAHRVLMLGPWEDCQPCNLIAGWSAQKVRGFLGWLASKVSASEGYWGSEGVVDGVLAWEALKVARQEDPTLADLFWALSDPRGLCREIETAHSDGAFDAGAESRALWKRIQDRSQGAYVFSLFHAGGLEGAIRSSSDSSETRQQYAWQTARILSALRKIAETPSLKAAFCAQQSLDWEGLWINQRAMVFLDCPQAIFGEACAMANSILRANFRDLVKSLSPARRRELGFGDTRFWLWICDEFQQLAREGAEGLSDDDSLWLDSSRAWGVINVLATQSISSLRAKLPQTADSLAQNCRALIALPSSDEATVARCAFLAGPQAGRVSEALARPTRDIAFLHFHGGARWAAGCVAPLRSGASDFMRARFDLDSDRARERGLLREERAVSAWEKGEGLTAGEGLLSHVSPGAWQALRQEAAKALGPLQWIDDGSRRDASALETDDSPAWAWDAAGAAAPRAENAAADTAPTVGRGAPEPPERLLAALRRQEGLDWPALRLDARRARSGLARASREGVLLLGRMACAEGGVREWARSLGLSGATLGFLAATGQSAPRAMLGSPESEWAPELAQSVGLGAAGVEEMAWRMGMWASALAAAKLGAVALEDAEREALPERALAWLDEPLSPDGAQSMEKGSSPGIAPAKPSVQRPLSSTKKHGVEFTLNEALGRERGAHPMTRASRSGRPEGVDLEVGQIDMDDVGAEREENEEVGERERLGALDEEPWVFDLDAEARGSVPKGREEEGVAGVKEEVARGARRMGGKSPLAAKKQPPAHAFGKGQNPSRQKRRGERKGAPAEREESEESAAHARGDASSDASKEFFFRRSARVARSRESAAAPVADPPLEGGQATAIKGPNQWRKWKTGPLQETSLDKSLVSEGFGWKWRAEAQEALNAISNSGERLERGKLSVDNGQESLPAEAKGPPERARRGEEEASRQPPAAFSPDAADWAGGGQSEEEAGFAREKQERLARERQWEMDAMGEAEGVNSNDAAGWEALDPEGLLGAENASGWIEMDAWGRASERARSAKPGGGGADSKKGGAAAGATNAGVSEAVQKGQGKTTARDKDR